MDGHITVEFQVHHNISQDQCMFVTGNLHHLGAWNTKAALRLKWMEGGMWIGKLQIPKRAIYHQTKNQQRAQSLNLQYKYFITSEWREQWEECNNHHLNVVLLGGDGVTVRDIWNVGIGTSPVIQILPAEYIKDDSPSLLHFGWSYGHECHRMKIVGSIDRFGNWDVNNGLEMTPCVTVGSNEMIWTVNVQLDSHSNNIIQYLMIRYKYVMVSNYNGGVVWEGGDNRERHLIPSLSSQNSISLCVDGYFQLPPHFNHGWAASGYAGLTNTFAACSMNSVIQMLYHLPSFKQMLYENQQKQNPGMSAPLAALFQKMDGDAFSGNVRSLVERIGLAEDPHEFLILLLFDLKAELQINEDEPTLVDGLFCGKQKIIRTRVGETTIAATEREEDFLGITLQVDGFATLEQSLVNFLSPSSIVLAQHTYQQHIEFSKLPKMLIVHLNRIMFDSEIVKEIKLCNRFEYPTKFRLTPSNIYHLFAVVVHRGNSSASDGHFYSYIKRNKIWYRFDDENIDIVSKHDAIEANFGGDNSNSHAYILVYLPHEKPPKTNKV